MITFPTIRAAAKWIVLGAVVGILSGSASALFLMLLGAATRIFSANPALIFALPLAGFAVGYVYWRYGGAAAQGSNLVIAEIHAQKQHVPFRMGPLVLAGTVITHLFGGSAGREGTAIQMGASLADTVRRVLKLGAADRRILLSAGVSGGFASVFGTPVAGFVFGLEVPSAGRIRYDGALACLVAALVGDLTTRAWGVGHTHYPRLIALDMDALLLAKVALAALAFGLAALIFVRLIEVIKHQFKSRIAWAPLHPVIGGAIVIVLTLLIGTTDYNGLSLPLIERSVAGEPVFPLAFLLKIVFTAVTLGSGFMGGEVTPLFAIGSTLGAALAGPLGVEAGLLASVGFVAVFAGASNTPLACAMMGIELFGGGGAVYLLTGCLIAFLASGHHSIYLTQRIGAHKWRPRPPTFD